MKRSHRLPHPSGAGTAWIPVHRVYSNPPGKVTAALVTGTLTTESRGQALIVIKKEAINSWRSSHPLFCMMDWKPLMLGKQSLNHRLPRTACQGKTGLHTPLILLLNPWHPSQLLLETGHASSWTQKSCTYLLLQACAQALCWAELESSPNPRLGLCQKEPRMILHQPALGGRRRMAALELHSSKGFASTKRCRDRQVL